MVPAFKQPGTHLGTGIPDHFKYVDQQGSEIKNCFRRSKRRIKERSKRRSNMRSKRGSRRSKRRRVSKRSRRRGRRNLRSAGLALQGVHGRVYGLYSFFSSFVFRCRALCFKTDTVQSDKVQTERAQT